MAGYSGSKRSKEEFAAGEDDMIKQQQLENPAKLARGGWDGGDASSEQHWKRVHHQSSSSTLSPAPQPSSNTSSSSGNNNNNNNSNSSGNNPQLNFQQRVLAAAALQEIRASSPVASFKFPLDSSSTSSSGLLDHLPPLSPALPQQQTPQRSARDHQLDSLYTPLLQNLPPIVHSPLKMSSGDVLGCGSNSYSGLLQAPVQVQQQAQMIHQPSSLQIPMLPPAPGLLGRDPCSWFSSSNNMNPVSSSSSGGMIGKEGLLVPPPLPPYQDVLSSLMPPLSSFPAPAPDFSEYQQLNPPLLPNIQQQQQIQQAQQQAAAQQASCSYRSDLIPPPAEMMFSNNNNTGFGSNSSGSFQRASHTKMINHHQHQHQHQQQQQVVNTSLSNGGLMNNMMNSSGGKYVSAAGHQSSYCSSELGGSSVTSVHNAASSSNTSTGMQNESPEDGTTLAQRIHHNQQHHHTSTTTTTTGTTTTTATATNHKQPPTRTYTKVYKLGSIGRAVDVTRFSNYTELRWELARMFNLEGQLDQKSGWQLVFIDHEGDILLVGDDPWEEFVTSVRGIRILSPSEVAFYTTNETGSGGAHSTLTSNGI